MRHIRRLNALWWTWNEWCDWRPAAGKVQTSGKVLVHQSSVYLQGEHNTGRTGNSFYLALRDIQEYVRQFPVMEAIGT